MSSLMTVSADSGLCSDYILPLPWDSNISHFECCSDLLTTDHLITMSNNSLMNVSLVSYGNSVCECQGPAFLLCCTLFNMFRSPE